MVALESLDKRCYLVPFGLRWFTANGARAASMEQVLIRLFLPFENICFAPNYWYTLLVAKPSDQNNSASPSLFTSGWSTSCHKAEVQIDFRTGEITGLTIFPSALHRYPWISEWTQLKIDKIASFQTNSNTTMLKMTHGSLLKVIY